MNKQQTIRFEFEGKLYECSMAAYDADYAIILPDRRKLRVDFWHETMPPKPASVTLLPEDSTAWACGATEI